MAVILGVDPGSRITGFGVVESTGGKLTYITSGCIRTEGTVLSVKLGQIYSGLSEVMEQRHPDYMSIEEVFLSKNVQSALKLGQARGAAMVTGVNHNIPVYEYSARQIKQAVVGYGNAEKIQVQDMVIAILKLSGRPQIDASDALACAICHANTISSLIGFSIGGLSSTKGNARGRIY